MAGWRGESTPNLSLPSGLAGRSPGRMKHTEFLAIVPDLFYCPRMPNKPHPRRAPSALSFKIGRWAEAHATGWGLMALVILAIVGGKSVV